MHIWTGFVLGLVGSLHCAGMCGPLLLATPAGSHKSSFALWRGPLFYNLGRITTYATLGVGFGIVGQTFALAGFQRWASLLAGIAVLLACTCSSTMRFGTPLVRSVQWIKARLARLLRRRDFSAQLALGALNGLLPCGLVYVACAGAVSSGSVLAGAAYMAAFGLGTVPMMLAIGLLGRRMQLALRFRYRHLLPVCAVLLGALLVVRGLALGIPYLSPDIAHLSGPRSCH